MRHSASKRESTIVANHKICFVCFVEGGFKGKHFLADLASLPNAAVVKLLDEHGTSTIQLLQQLCTGCSSARYRHLHGGFSGASVVKLVKFKQGRQQVPTVVKLDSASEIEEEVRAMRQQPFPTRRFR